MSDLISRGDAIKAVLVSNLSACTVFGRSEEGMATAKELIQVIKNLPSVQPEIIRCKDCENYQTDWQPLSFDDGHYCAMVDTIMPYDGFCHMGERREDERLNRQTDA